jgi:hypothetical protein
LENNVPPWLYLTFLLRIFMKLHTYHSLGMLYKWYKFCCDQSIKRGTLLEEERIFLAESHLQFKRFFFHSTFISHCSCPTIGIGVVAIGQSQRALYLENEVCYRLYLAFSPRDFYETTYLTLTKHALQLE